MQKTTVYLASDTHCASGGSAIEADPGPFVVFPLTFSPHDDPAGGGCRAGRPLRAAVHGSWRRSTGQSSGEPAPAIERRRDQEIGLADASLAVLAERYRTDRLLSLGRPHLGVVRTAEGRSFSPCPG